MSTEINEDRRSPSPCKTLDGKWKTKKETDHIEQASKLHWKETSWAETSSQSHSSEAKTFLCLKYIIIVRLSTNISITINNNSFVVSGLPVAEKQHKEQSPAPPSSIARARSMLLAARREITPTLSDMPQCYKNWVQTGEKLCSQLSWLEQISLSLSPFLLNWAHFANRL